jgi:hypothetical protein
MSKENKWWLVLFLAVLHLVTVLRQGFKLGFIG